MRESDKKITDKNSQLTKELFANTLVNEVSRVMLSSSTLSRAINSYFLGVSEITGLSKMALFSVDRDGFCLKATHSLGTDLTDLTKLDLPLTFSAGEYPDAIFLNKHIIMDSLMPSDPFSTLGISSYVSMPILSRITTKCWEAKNCGCKSCPCYEGHNPYCWSVMDAALFENTETEDDKRKACVACAQFKCNSVLWLDTTELSETIGAGDIGNLTVLNQHLGMVIETFTMYDEIKASNLILEKNNKTLSTLNEDLNAAHARINRELDQARTIQKGLLPEIFPQERLLDVAARYSPAGKVGGDYYDCFELDKNLIGIVMADVSGHGIAAALIMSMFKVLLKEFSPLHQDPKKILLQINGTLLGEIKSTNFVTVFFGVFNKETRVLTYCNAGHPSQLLIKKDGESQELASTGLFIGILDDVMLVQEEIKLEENSRLILFTDGILEAKSPDNEMYGFDRFKKFVIKNNEYSCPRLIDLLIEDFNKFCQGQVAIDDITVFMCNL